MTGMSSPAKKLMDSVYPIFAAIDLNPEDVTDVAPLLGRNKNGRIRFADASEIFVKQINGMSGPERFARSVSFHQAIEHPESVDTSTPRLLAGHEESLTLAFECIDGDAGLGGRVRDGEVSDDELSRLGRCLAGLHDLDVLDAEKTDRTLPNFPPHGPNTVSMDVYHASTIGQLEVWRMFQNDEELRRASQALVLTDAPKVPIHGDFRGDQVLIADGRMWILDWEDFRLGDGARDVGALIGDVFYHRIHKAFASFAGGTPGTVDERTVVDRGVGALEFAAPRVRTVADAYRGARPVLDDGFFDRAIRYFGWQLFDRALAAASYFGRLSPIDRALAGIGREAMLSGGAYAVSLGLVEPVEAVAA